MLSIAQNISLKPYNTLAVDVQAAVFITVTELAQIPAAVDYASQHQLPWLVLGGGSNVVLTDDFDGVVIYMQLRGIKIEEQDQQLIVSAAAGENWHQLVQYCLKHKCYGLENLSLIPGSVGAAPIQNIGAYGVELAQVFHSLTGWDCQHQQWRNLTLTECQFGYRDSIFKQQLKNQFIITSVSLRLHRNCVVQTSYAALNTALQQQQIEQPSPEQVADTVIAIRQSKLPDPKNLANAGSFFKNPVISAAHASTLLAENPGMVSYVQNDGTVKLAAGWLIEKVGWKGKRLGAVGMHEQQSLVLINYDNATGSDIITLAKTVQQNVKEKFAIDLNIEPVII